MRSLRDRILLVAGTVLVLTALAIIFSGARLFSQAYSKSIAERSMAVSNEVATQFERILAVGLGPGEIVGFEDQCDRAVASHEGIGVVAVLGPDGRSIFRSRAGGGGPLDLPFLAEAIASGQPRQLELALPEGRLAAVVTPVFDTGRTVVGAVLVGASQAAIDRSLREVTIEVLAVGAGFIVLSTIVLHITLTSFVTNPLVAVIEAINEVRRRPPEEVQPITVAAAGETADVVETINSLLARQKQHLSALVIAKEMAETASRAKSTFLANVSHELRTPLNGILGLTSLAMRRATDEKQREQLAKVEGASRHLLAIINDILDISRIEADRLTLAPLDFTFAKVVDDLFALCEPLARAKGLSLAVEVAPGLRERRFRGDPVRVGQVLLNLVGNAIKFTERGGVTVRAAAVGPAESGAVVRFEVADTGIGIAPEALERLFTPFEQADGSLTRRYGGTGLGLAISRRLVELMGGTIEVASTVGAGSTFRFTVRLAEAGGGVAGETESGEEGGIEQQLRERFGGTRVLLVEDDPINRDVFRELLKHAGLEVDEAHDGEQAVAMAGQRPYALVLMDVQMPRMNGLEATRALRADPRHAALPIVAVTANSLEGDREACLAAGMNDHVAKPVAVPRLYAKVLEWLSRRAGVTSGSASSPSSGRSAP